MTDSGRKSGGKKLTKEQKAQALALAMQGMTVSEVARQLNVDSLRVSGTIQAARNAGRLPPEGAPPGDFGTPSPPPPPPPMPQEQVLAPAAPAPPAPKHQVQNNTQPAPSSDGYTWSPIPGGGAFVHPAQVVKYLVERLAPNNDGLVGVHTTPPSDDEIAKKYGHGSYRVAKQVPGKYPEYRDNINVSKAFGPSRWPNTNEEDEDGREPSRSYPQRPWARTSPRGDGSPHAPMAPHPRSYYPPQRPATPSPDYERERAFSEFARQSASGTESIAVTVVDKLSDLQEKTLQRMEAQAARGPDTFIKDFYEQQQKWEQKRSSEDKQKEEERRKLDLDHQNQRQRDDEQRYRRWQEEQDQRHARDMERIKEERKTMIELEDKKLALIKEEARAREELLRKEIDSHRARVEEVQEASESRISEMQDSVKQDLARGREGLDKEYTIREKALENEHALRKEMIDLRGEIIKAQAEATKSQNQDDLTRLITQLVEGAKETIGKVVELKKFQMGTPEDRAAAMGQQEVGGDVQTIPPGALPSSPPPVSPPVAAASPTKEPGGNGHAVPQSQGDAFNIEAIFQENLKAPMAQYVLREWALTLRQGKDPAMFVNTFMEFMKDETPSGSEGRKAVSAFTQLMDNRDWPEMKRLLLPAIPDDLKEEFDAPDADAFYNAFRVMACGSVRDYWNMYLADKRRAEQERAAAYQQQAAQQQAAQQQAAQQAAQEPPPAQEQPAEPQELVPPAAVPAAVPESTSAPAPEPPGPSPTS